MQNRRSGHESSRGGSRGYRSDMRNEYRDEHRGEEQNQGDYRRGERDFDRSYDRTRRAGSSTLERDYGNGKGYSDSTYQRGAYIDDRSSRNDEFYPRASNYRGEPREEHHESMWKSVKDFFGKGPKGYKRSDERIREDVCEALYRHPDVDASEIEVSVSGAEVTLKGTVEDRRAKRMAEDAAEGVSGVDNVRNEIRVQSGTFRKSTTELSPTDRAEKAKGKSSDRLI